jgi:hypothetical protein
VRRSQRIAAAARHEAGMAGIFCATALAAGAWTVRAAQSHPGGCLLAVVALAAFRLAWWHAVEWRRLARLARRERCHEAGFYRMEVRL